ncbi:MAG: hypothetical protein FJ087_22820, partial [Deltaproteobacteria bacterium]|nr:hypothetical protein [Deltaproteobacteria bacterium]
MRVPTTIARPLVLPPLAPALTAVALTAIALPASAEPLCWKDVVRTANELPGVRAALAHAP